MKAILALEDGRFFEGESFGATATTVGEICFNTSMTGYQEVLTDPSYRGQIVAMTYPLIGNYGTNALDQESRSPHVRGFVIEELSEIPSSWRSETSLEDYLKRWEVPGIQGVDTRALTRHLRERGAMKACLTSDKITTEEATRRAVEGDGVIGMDYVREVSTAKPYQWDPEDRLSQEWSIANGEGRAKRKLPPVRFHIVAYDYGLKENILRRLRNLIGKKPIFGICLGHQVLGYAFGGRTFKLKFGHRGGNQPVKDLRTGRIAITSQNHGFAIEPDSLPPEVEITHVNLNDGTVEGMRHRELPIFSVQYHPEAAPGPHDASYFFSQFAELIEGADKAR